MLASARSFSKQVLNHRTQIQQQTKSQIRNQHSGPRSGRKDQQQQQQNDQAKHINEPDEDAHRQSLLMKMRQENRERKKRWRELNEERNKDNDLRCRVNKRATQLYGAHSTPAKEKWIVEEFERRQQRRKEKEMRKRQQQQAGYAAEAAADADGLAVPQQARKSARTAMSPPAAADAQDPAASPLDPSGAHTARRQQPAFRSQQAPHSRAQIPTGFGNYLALPPHQVRAAYDFWRSVAEQHALEASSSPSAAAAHHNHSSHHSHNHSHAAGISPVAASRTASISSTTSTLLGNASGAGSSADREYVFKHYVPVTPTQSYPQPAAMHGGNPHLASSSSTAVSSPVYRSHPNASYDTQTMDMAVADEGGDSNRLTLPPLSSVVPEAYMSSGTGLCGESTAPSRSISMPSLDAAKGNGGGPRSPPPQLPLPPFLLQHTQKSATTEEDKVHVPASPFGCSTAPVDYHAQAAAPRSSSSSSSSLCRTIDGDASNREHCGRMHKQRAQQLPTVSIPHSSDSQLAASPSRIALSRSSSHALPSTCQYERRHVRPWEQGFDNENASDCYYWQQQQQKAKLSMSPPPIADNEVARAATLVGGAESSGLTEAAFSLMSLSSSASSHAGSPAP